MEIEKKTKKLTFSNSFFPSIVGLIIWVPLYFVLNLVLLLGLGLMGFSWPSMGIDLSGLSAVLSIGIIYFGIKRWALRDNKKP